MTLTELYEDIYQRLTESEALAALIGSKRIYDYLPDESVAGPYVVIGDTNEVEGRLINDDERKVYIRLHIWSSYRGRSQTIAIERVIESVLMADKNNYIFDSFQVLRDNEDWVHGVIVFRAYIEKGAVDQ